MIIDPSNYHRPDTDDEMAKDFGWMISTLDSDAKDRLLSLLFVHGDRAATFKTMQQFLRVEASK